MGKRKVTWRTRPPARAVHAQPVRWWCERPGVCKKGLQYSPVSLNTYTCTCASLPHHRSRESLAVDGLHLDFTLPPASSTCFLLPLSLPLPFSLTHSLSLSLCPCSRSSSLCLPCGPRHPWTILATAPSPRRKETLGEGERRTPQPVPQVCTRLWDNLLWRNVKKKKKKKKKDKRM